MAQRTISRMYDSYDTAKTVVRELEAAGIPHSEISMIANADAHGRDVGGTGPGGTAAGSGVTGSSVSDAGTTGTAATPEASTGSGTGAVLGTVLGGGAGLLAGIGSLAIPGVGPVVAAGWLIATLTGAGIGAGAGGLIGALTGAGVSHGEANVYAEGIRRGGTLVTVRADETQIPRVEQVFSRYGADDWEQRRTTYGVSETATPTGGNL